MDATDADSPSAAAPPPTSSSASCGGALVRVMCSYGGRIVPRPHDSQLRYIGGDTRLVAFPRRGICYAALMKQLSRLSGSAGGGRSVVVKYQLPSEELDALISVTSDEDLENMLDEYDRLLLGPAASRRRLRLFLFPCADSADAASPEEVRRGEWFVQALNGGGGGGPSSSAASSLVGPPRPLSSVLSTASEIIPDYLFGLEEDKARGDDDAGHLEQRSNGSRSGVMEGLRREDSASSLASSVADDPRLPQLQPRSSEEWLLGRAPEPPPLTTQRTADPVPRVEEVSVLPQTTTHQQPHPLHSTYVDARQIYTSAPYAQPAPYWHVDPSYYVSDTVCMVPTASARMVAPATAVYGADVSRAPAAQVSSGGAYMARPIVYRQVAQAPMLRPVQPMVSPDHQYAYVAKSPAVASGHYVANPTADKIAEMHIAAHGSHQSV